MHFSVDFQTQITFERRVAAHFCDRIRARLEPSFPDGWAKIIFRKMFSLFRDYFGN
jgi:hypothetical protein